VAAAGHSRQGAGLLLADFCDALEGRLELPRICGFADCARAVRVQPPFGIRL